MNSKLKQSRIRKGYTQAQLAELLDYNYIFIYNMFIINTENTALAGLTSLVEIRGFLLKERKILKLTINYSKQAIKFLSKQDPVFFFKPEGKQVEQTHPS